MRGKPLRDRSGRPLTGITPAHAGKTDALHRAPRCAQDHPRACGENDLDGLQKSLKEGSPPRMRGKPIASTLFAGGIRITPAHAGKTY